MYRTYLGVAVLLARKQGSTQSPASAPKTQHASPSALSLTTPFDSTQRLEVGCNQEEYGTELDRFRTDAQCYVRWPLPRLSATAARRCGAQVGVRAPSA